MRNYNNIDQCTRNYELFKKQKKNIVIANLIKKTMILLQLPSALFDRKVNNEKKKNI